MFQMKFGNHKYKININIYIRLIYTDIYVQIKMGSCAWISLSILLLPLVSEREFLHNLQTVNNIKNEKAPQYVYVCNVLCIVIYPTKNYVTRSNGMLIFEIDFPMVNISNL